MKIAVLFFFIGFAASASNYVADYDSIDIGILSNEKAVNAFIDCFLEQGPCDPEAANIKSDIIKILDSKCIDCSETQKKFVKKFGTLLIEDLPEAWDSIMKKYDPDNKNRAAMEKAIKEL